MSGNSLVIDTNIALYLLSGDQKVASILQDSQIYISFITELELLGYKNITPTEHRSIKNFLSDCIIIDINDAIKNHVVSIRKLHSVKLPDSIIASTALFLELPLLSADKGYKRITGFSLLLYSAK